MNVKCHCPNYKITHIQILYIISSHKKKKKPQNVWLKQKISKLHIANNTAFSLFYIPLFSCSSHATFRYRRKNSSFFVLIFITDVCQSEVSIVKILKCSNCLSVMLHSLSKHLIFKVGRAKHWLFPHPFFVSTGSSRRTETVCGCSYNLYRKPALQPHSEFTCSCFTMYMMPYLIWSRPKSLKSLSSDLCGFLIRLLMACEHCCLLGGVKEWSFNLCCSFFLPNSSMTLKMQDCKRRHLFFFAARTCTPWICWLE